MKLMNWTLILILIALLATPIFAQDMPKIDGTLKADHIFQHNGLALRGYDPVAYFSQSKAVEGNKQFEDTHLGATWRFASEENRDAFKKNPDRYLPQYGGYCAFGMSNGYAAPIDPQAWKIIDGKLYLNYSLDVQKEWIKDPPGFISKADKNWPKIPKNAKNAD